MAQTGYTPILIYSSSTASALPSASNLTNSTLGSELAININDGKLFYKDNANNVQVIGWKTVPTTAGGTGLTSYTAGDLLYYATGTALSKLSIGATNQILTSNGTAPQWNSAITVTGLTDSGNLTFTGTGNRITGDFSNATVANRVAFQNSVTNGATNLQAIPNGTSLTAGYVAYNNSDPTNASIAQLRAQSDQVVVNSGITGTGTYLPMTFLTGGSERLRIDTSGNVGVGTNLPATILNVYNATSAIISVDGDSTTNFRASRYSSDATASAVTLRKGRGTLASPSAVNTSDTVGQFNFQAYGGSNFRGIVQIASVVETYTGDNDISGALTFSTRPTGVGAALTERMRISSTGNVVAGGSVALATNATDGFLYVPTCAGTPTGTPTTITGMAPIVVNTTNNKLYFYSGGVWRDAGP